MKEEGTIFKPGRLVNAATLGKKKMTREERKKYYDSLPPGNKSIEAARRNQGSFIIYDPAFML